MNNRIHNLRALTYLTLLLFLVLSAGKVIAREGESSACFSKSDRFYTVSNVLHVKDAFYAVDYKGRVLRTLDGNEWSVQQVTEKSSPWLQDIAWNGEYFVVTTIDSDIYRSVDAKIWQRVAQVQGGIGVARLRAYDGVFYLLGRKHTRLDPLPHSKDNGLTWQAEPAFTTYPVIPKRVQLKGQTEAEFKRKHAANWNVADLIRVKDQYYYTLARERLTWKLPDITLANWHMVESTSRDRDNEKKLRRISGWLAYGNGRFVAADQNGSRVLTSDDGEIWKERALGINNPDKFVSYVSDIEWVGKEFILVGKQGTILRSKKGDIWSKDKVPTNGTLSGIASNGDIHIAVGDPPLDCSTSTSVLVYRNGKGWENVSDKIDQAIHATQASGQNSAPNQ
jgi:hypothetical protein